ncbi:DUF432 domain-containing protein [Chromatiaceae bacterium AAb-1]|nr:DUF432 domain-containing protein [Chromatiaceae bacterium AAb-1]
MTKSEIRQKPLAPWWHPVSLEAESCYSYAIGPLTLYLKRQEHEWQLAFERQEENEDLFRVLNHAAVCMPSGLKTHRYIFQHSPDSFQLKPVLPERPLVVRTRQPVNIPDGGQSTFYISCPVSVQVTLPATNTLLQEIPVLRLSDTWFGPSTQVGELCYATKTQARHDRADIPLRPHRAVTPVTIINRSGNMLTIEKLSIPVPLLAVYGAPDGTLWTDPISLEHDGEHALARLTFTGKLPAGLSTAERLSSPRISSGKHSLVRAFASIFNQ